MTDTAANRLDTFADAAFAFAVTLMVVGGGGMAVDADLLGNSIASIPSFAIAFAIIAMFWHAHVRWRKLRGEGDVRSVALTLVLIFTVLSYIVPLRAMATSFAALIGGSRNGFSGGNLGLLFTVYGIGFVAMSTLTALLFRDVLRRDDLSAADRRAVLGEIWIWTILAMTGVCSAILSLIPSTRMVAPFLYATLPMTIGLFSWRWRWTP